MMIVQNYYYYYYYYLLLINKKRGRAGVLVNLVMREEGRKFEKQPTHHYYDRTLLLMPRQ